MRKLLGVAILFSFIVGFSGPSAAAEKKSMCCG
jgi:hypothetical protein